MIPSFNGQVKDWAEFRHSLQALVWIGNYPEILQITQLRIKLPAEAVALISGLYEVVLG
jgi:hypothetical protein